MAHAASAEVVASMSIQIRSECGLGRGDRNGIYSRCQLLANACNASSRVVP